MHFMIYIRPETQHRGPASHSESDLPEQEEEILGSDDDEQEDPNDYCKGEKSFLRMLLFTFGIEN